MYKADYDMLQDLLSICITGRVFLTNMFKYK
jgi:hypothetical protein